MSDQRSVEWVVCEISEEMKKDVEQVVNQALDDKRDLEEKDIAAKIKAHFDMRYAPNWHCVVGKSFASYVTYSSKHYIFFYIAQMAILLYKL